MSARIDVDPGQAQIANSVASQSATTAPVSAPSAPASAPGMFAGMAPSMAATSGGFTQAEAAIKTHLGSVDLRSGQAVTSYEVTNEDNRRSLTAIREA